MIWETLNYQQQQLPLAGSVEPQNLQPKSQPQDETVCSVEETRRQRKTAYYRQWSAKNRDKIRTYQRQNDYAWRTRTPELKAKMKEKQRRMYQKHKARRLEDSRKWVEQNKEKRLQIQRNYRIRHKEKLRVQSLETYYKRKHIFQSQEWKDKHNAYVARQRRTNVQFMLAQRLRATMHQAIRRQFGKKAFKTKQLLGCTVAELKEHLERQFVNGMNWSDRRSFVIDHYVPCRAFDLTKVEEQRWCFNWRNLRPMAHHDNQVKSDTIPDPLPAWLPVEIQRRIKERVI